MRNRNQNPTYRQMQVMFLTRLLHPASYRDIADYLKITYRAVHDRAVLLIRKGLLSQEYNKHRSISITPAGIKAMQEYGFRPDTQEVYGICRYSDALGKFVEISDSLKRMRVR